MNYLPLATIEEDKLGFNETSKSIANFINNFPNNQPYSIAVYGDWGSGKSTMLNFVEQELDDKNIIIRFNPWEILNDENLIPTIFEELAYAIEIEKYKKLKKKLVEYARKVCSTTAKIASRNILIAKGIDEDTSDTIADFNSGIVESIFNSNSPTPLSKRKKELEVELLKWSKKEKKKIVIFIDEIDRLFPSEIVEIFKLIKATISFPGVIFLVAMDKNAVKDSLLSINISRPDEYLVKLFQQQYFIHSDYQLRTLFREVLISNIVELEDNSKKSLLSAINATIFLKEEDQYFSDSKNYNKDVVKNSYFAIYDELRHYLSVPRNFINYSSYIKSNWSKYFRQLNDDEFDNSRDSIILFLILTLYYINPEFVTNQYLATLHPTQDIQDRMTPLLKKLRFGILTQLFKEERIPNPDKPNTYMNYRNDEIIQKIVFAIRNYPDRRN